MQNSRSIRSVTSSGNIAYGNVDFDCDLRFRLYSESYEDETGIRSPMEPCTPTVR